MQTQASPTTSSFPNKYQGETPLLPARLVVDLPNWLGDLVMALPATVRLVAANRGGTTILHARHSTARLVSALFPEVEVLSSSKKENPLRTAQRFRGLGPRADVGLTMRNAGRAKVLLRMVSRWSAGTRSQGGRSLLSWAYDPEFGRHQVHDADSALARLGLEGANAGWRGELPEPLLVSGRKALHGAGLDTKAFIVGLAPGVAWGGSAKRWPAEKFGHLARRLRDRGFEPVVVIGPGEAELARSVVEASGIGLPVVAEDLDAAGLGAVLRNLSCLIGNDSGPAHLASVLGVATIALFGPTDDQRTAPMMPEATVMSRRLDCAPCGQATCPLLHKACLTDLPESDVCDAVADLLEDARPVARVQ